MFIYYFDHHKVTFVSFALTEEQFAMTIECKAPIAFQVSWASAHNTLLWHTSTYIHVVADHTAESFLDLDYVDVPVQHMQAI